MVNIYLSCAIVSFTLIVYGNFFLSLLKEKPTELDQNFSECGLFGIILLSFISLLVNFFFPINVLFNNLILILGFIYGCFYINFTKKFFCILILSSFLSTLLITLNNINRPDAGLYHLPFISILNDDKIIIGLSNLHTRFGHISIIQYASSIFNNSLLNDKGIIIPLALCIVFFLMYTVTELFYFLKKKFDLIKFIFLFLLSIFSLYSFSNYSEYGNDAPAFIYFFLTIILYLSIDNQKKNLYNDKKILITSIFTVLNKIFFILIIFIAIIIIFTKLRELLKRKFFSFFIIFFISIWLLKNVFATSCILYPVKITCIKNLSWYNEKNIDESHISSEAWAKAWIDQDEPKLSLEEYSKKFRWLRTWSKKHLKKINEKFTPFIIFNILFVASLFLKYQKDNIFFYKSKKTLGKIKIILFINILGSLFWFLKFPIYRYGAAYLACSVSSISVLILYYFNNNIAVKKNLIKIIILFSIFLFISFNLKRIIRNFDNVYYQYPWPRIYSLAFDNISNQKVPIKYNEKIIFYKSVSECMYTKYSPCTHETRIVQYKESLGYKIFY